jgi:cell division protein FtsB
MRQSVTGLRIACCAVVLVIAAFLFAYPTQSLLAQQRSVNESRRHLASIEQQNRDLQIQARRLRLASEIERVAREKYNMARPNEKAYTVVLKPKKKTTTTTTHP